MDKGHRAVAGHAVAPVFGEVLSLLTYAVNRQVALMKPSRKVCLAWTRPTAGQAEAISQETAQDPSVAAHVPRAIRRLPPVESSGSFDLDAPPR